jgi:hypothetical protein
MPDSVRLMPENGTKDAGLHPWTDKEAISAGKNSLYLVSSKMRMKPAYGS